MNKKTALLAIVLLLISNIICGYFLLGKKKHDRKTEMFEKTIKDLSFDKKQADSFKAMRTIHLLTTEPLMRKLQNSREEYVKTLIANINDTALIFSKLLASNKLMYELDVKVLNGLWEAKKICKPDQIAKFDSLIIERMLWRRNNLKK